MNNIADLHELWDKRKCLCVAAFDLILGNSMTTGRNTGSYARNIDVWISSQNIYCTNKVPFFFGKLQ